MSHRDPSIFWRTQDMHILLTILSLDFVHYGNIYAVPHSYSPTDVTHVVPYLKEGKHGPGGDLDLDSDRATGKDHN
jgi:hypothetical protein